MKLLVVDDDDCLREAILSILKDSYDVSVAANGVEALLILNSSQEDWIVITDYQMPLMNGHELLSKISQQSMNLITGVILMSGASEVKEVSDRLKADFRAKRIPYFYLEKPFRSVTLQTLIEDIYIQRVHGFEVSEINEL